MSSVSRSSVSRRCRRTRRGTRSAGVIGTVLATIVATVVVGTAVLTPPAAGIVGGRATQPGELPFMVSVQSADRTGPAAHFCGGSVLRKRLVLTAAHCVSDRRPQDLRVVVGDHRLDGSVGRAHAVDKIRVHPRYAATGTHDVAILRTTTPMRVPRLRIVGARNNAFETNGARLTVAGWGATFFLLGPLSNVLRAVDVRAVADPACLLNGLMGFRPGTEMCAQTLAGDSCQGDSGGPLFGRRADGRPVQVGVVSYGLGCATPLFPGVYAELNSPAIRPFLVTTVRAEAAALRKAARRAAKRARARARG